MLQPSVISATLNGNTIQSLQYGYGPTGANNGGISAIVNGMDPTRSQTYQYDNLNRLSVAQDASHWGEAYTYDNWGNMLAKTVMQGSGYQFSVSQTNNRLSNQQYDAAGELTTDQLGTAYTYNAEGRLLSAGAGSYVYDGDGNRVMKTVGGSTTLYWPGSGSLLDESNATGTTMAKQISFGGLQVWSESLSTGGRFLFQDHLGSARITADASGNLLDDNDYLPFGSVAANYGSAPSDNHYTFTGDESDQSESGTDYAVFRNLGTAMGRFNRPDPYAGSYDFTNPQSLNRFSYGLNNPMQYVDTLGLTASWSCVTYTFYVDGQYDSTTDECELLDDGEDAGGEVHPGDPVHPVAPSKPCPSGGNAPTLNQYQAAGQAASNSMASSDLLQRFAGFKFNFSNLLAFHRGGSLDAQAFGGSTPYANYAYGVYMSAAGYSLRQTLDGAALYASLFANNGNAQPSSQYPSMKAANVTSITNGYNAQQKGVVTCP